MRTRRRDFLGSMAAGGALLSMPPFLAGCGVQRATRMAVEPPVNPFLQWFGIDEPAISNVLAELSANGADVAELFFQHQRTSLLVMEEGIVSRAETEILQGVGLRVVVGDRTGYAFTEDLTLPGMLAAARTSASIARGQEASVPQSFNTKPAGGLYRTEVAWTDVEADRKMPILERVDRQARLSDPSVDTVSVQLSDVDERVLIATLDGHLIADRRPLTRLSVQLTAVRGAAWRSGFSSISAREGFGWYTNERIDGMVQEAVDRTSTQFEAVESPVGELPVVLAAGTGGILLHEAIGHALEGDFARDGTSAYARRIGQAVAGPFVTVVDQGTLPGQRGALNYDDEGTECGRNVLVENGILRGYLHDAISAAHHGVATTGSARRESYRFAPMPRMTCTYIADGPHTREEVIASVDHGIVAETFDGGRIALGAGDFTFHVRNGWLIEKGEITAPLRDFTITGNGPETLERMTMVANDSRFDTGGWTCGKKDQRVPVSQGIPTVLVSSMVVGSDDTG